MKKQLLFAFLLACGPAPTQETQVDVEEAFDTGESELTVGSRHGIWVYSPNAWLGVESQVNAFISFLLKNNLNEVYLSTPPTVLANSRLPYFINRMTNNGIAVEALIGKIEWGTSAGRADMLKQIESLKSYNARQTSSATRFKAVHLDVEPWIGTGTNTAWVSPLITSYQAARQAVAGSTLKLTADLAGSKVASLPLSQRQAMVTAVDRITLMQYETSIDNVLSRTTRFMNGIAFSGHEVLVAVRIKEFDYPTPCVSTMGRVDSTFLGKTGYGGWALFQYADMQ